MYKRLKKYFTMMLAIAILFQCTVQVQAIEKGSNVKIAETLKALGLFQGTNNGFELTRTSTRDEAAAMLVRLLGAEEQAKSEPIGDSFPFTDVQEWAKPYVNYLYKNGLTKGTGGNKFGSKDLITGNQYTTMLLRALGYNDQEGHFKWDEAVDFAGIIGLYESSHLSTYKKTAKSGIYRDDMVHMSYRSLVTNIRGTEFSLLNELYYTKAVSRDKLINAIKLDSSLAKYVNDDSLNEYEEMRAVWISYLDLQPVFKDNKTKESFEKAIKEMYANVKNSGLNTVIVQVRPFGDAIYPSKYFPWSHIISGTEGVNPGYDPFQIMVEQAHAYDLKIEAWINPFRIRASGSKVALSSDNIAAKWLEDGSRRALKISQGSFYNPGNAEARELIINGVVEIVQNYDVDGIHFDDYFYPSTSLDYDSADYQAYIKNGGKLSQEDWRRENVNQLVQLVYSSIKAVDPTVQFGISPQGSLENNYKQQFIDVKRWLANTTYIDYICPQIYYGYMHKTYPYLQTVKEWQDLIKVDTIKLYIGIAAYKIGTEDTYAGTAGKNEWITSVNILQKMVSDARTVEKYSGFMMFRYDFLYKPSSALKSRMADEMQALKSILE